MRKMDNEYNKDSLQMRSFEMLVCAILQILAILLGSVQTTDTSWDVKGDPVEGCV